MSAKLRLLVPEGTTNYIQNPSARYDTTGVSAAGSTITRVLTHARYGVSCFKVVTAGAALREGLYYRVSDLSGIQDVISVSASVRGTGFVRIRLIDNPRGKEWYSQRVELLSDRWQRIQVTGRCSGSNDVRLYIETDEGLAKARTFYVDGLQMERQEEATTYCDGDQPGCRWNLLAHGSHSIRSPYTRAGGRWIDIAGPSCQQQNLYATVIGGLGVAAIENQVQPYADAPGDYFQSVKVPARVLTITFHARIKDRPLTRKLPSLRALHRLRQQLFDVFKPDRTAGAQPLWLEYTDGEIPLYLQVHYAGGMEGEWDVRNQFVNSFPVRLLATFPFLTEDDQEISSLSFRATHTVNYILQRIDGEWSEMNGGFDAQVRALTVGSRGEIIAVGDFSLANNKTTAVDPKIFANHIAYWDGSKWNKYGSGANATIRAVAVAPNGNIYITGDFTSIGGVAANRVAYWDGSWHAMGSGLNARGYAIKVASNGDVYIGGEFTIAGGVTVNYFTRYDGSYHALGNYTGLNGFVYSIDITPDGTKVYLGGAFTDEYSDPGILSLNYVAVYEPLFAQFDDLGVGFDAAVRKVLLTPSGRLYAAGDFTESSDSALTLLYVAYWNGASWYEVGVGVNNTLRDLAVSPLGNILLGGDFAVAGSVDASYAALYNDSTFVNLDVLLSNAVYAVALDSQENMFVAPNGLTAQVAAITTLQNIGSAEVPPVLYVIGPCTLVWVENQTSHKRVYMNLELAEDEELSIDFAQGTVSSNTRGNLAYAVSPGSEMHAWTLMPGDNKIALLMTNDVLAQAYLSYVPRHWSADATARVEEL